jgi:predicted phage-related endonuclease
MIAALSAQEKQVERSAFIGASDAPWLYGMGGKSPYQLWLHKKRLVPPVVETEAMRWGCLLEPLVVAEYERLTGRTVKDRQLHVRTCEPPFVGATLDGRDDCGVVEIKTRRFPPDGLGKHGEPSIPPEWWVQMQHQMLCSRDRSGHLVCLIGGNCLSIHPIQFDDEWAAKHIEACSMFWRHVEGDYPPDPDSNDAKTVNDRLDLIEADRPGDNEDAYYIRYWLEEKEAARRHELAAKRWQARLADLSDGKRIICPTGEWFQVKQRTDGARVAYGGTDGY